MNVKNKLVFLDVWFCNKFIFEPLCVSLRDEFPRLGVSDSARNLSVTVWAVFFGWVCILIMCERQKNIQKIFRKTHFMLLCCCKGPIWSYCLSGPVIVFQLHAWDGVSKTVRVKSSRIFLTRSLDFSSRVCGSRSRYVILSSLWRSASTTLSRHKTEN